VPPEEAEGNTRLEVEAGRRLKDAKYLVGCKGTENRRLAAHLCLVWIECQLFAFTLHRGAKPNMKFELQIVIGFSTLRGKKGGCHDMVTATFYIVFRY